MKKILLQVVAIFALTALTFSCGNEEPQAETATAPQTETQVEPQAQPAEEPQVEETTASATNEIDEILDDYESAIDSYISIMKKYKNASSSDPMEAMNMMSDLNDYVSSIESLSNRIDACKANMTTEQSKRLVKLMNKYTEAASSMM